MKRIIITGVGKDKPGIVAGLTHLLSDCGGNIEDSTMTLLAGEFAMILIVSLPDDVAYQRLAAQLPNIEQTLQISLSVQPARDILAEDILSEEQRAQAQQSVMISVAGIDHTGITAQVTQLLADQHVNISDLNAQRIPGEHGPVYIMMIEAQLPVALSAEGLQAFLVPLASTLAVEIRVNPIEVMTL